MLENWIKPQIPEEEELDERLHAARSKLSVLQMQIKEHGLPVLVLFEGWGTAGKGSVLVHGCDLEKSRINILDYSLKEVSFDFQYCQQPKYLL